MANSAILRDEVHTLAEACGDAGDEFQPTATRLIKNQRRLSRFFEQNMAAMGPMPAQVSLYMLSVVLRIFEQVGGRMKKVTGQDLDAAMKKVQSAAADLMPADEHFIERAQSVDIRAQPHISMKCCGPCNGMTSKKAKSTWITTPVLGLRHALPQWPIDQN